MADVIGKWNYGDERNCPHFRNVPYSDLRPEEEQDRLRRKANSIATIFYSEYCDIPVKYLDLAAEFIRGEKTERDLEDDAFAREHPLYWIMSCHE